MKIAYNLYRVSTKQQVDKAKDDIPMQKIACQEFAQQHGWVIKKEFYEKGVSGFKVSANDRDAIQDLKRAALNHEFDVLLVYMFDRLGRRDDETPFVVEWFAQQGIEVWSTQEGQQTFENHTDKLLNYIRYWQANGESVKTSMRLKTRMAQLTADGLYHGGAVPLGYRAVYKGRLNKKGQPVRDLEIDPQEAEYVRLIFNKTLNEGYGSYRMAEYLNKLGVRTHNGKPIQSPAINRILKNKLYCGYYIAGDTTSPRLEHLVIIDDNTFAGVQNIVEQRAKKQEIKTNIAMTTIGKTLLSGNIYCAHCGCHMASTGGAQKYLHKDGRISKTVYLKYTCYHRARKLNDCDGQSVYSADRIDAAVLDVVKQYLSSIKQTPRDKALKMRYEAELREKNKIQSELISKRATLKKRLSGLAVEVGKYITGENRFSVDILNTSIEQAKEELADVEERIDECKKTLSDQKDMLGKLDYYYDQFLSWAAEFENASLEQRKMIICQLINEVRVGRGYKIDIDFNASYRQFVDSNMAFAL
ncbi:MAG: recombinase family protein [Clostridia bacterium]|nr:recombinase family protein [Clostridia bacterium]